MHYCRIDWKTGSAAVELNPRLGVRVEEWRRRGPFAHVSYRREPDRAGSSTFTPVAGEKSRRAPGAAFEPSEGHEKAGQRPRRARVAEEAESADWGMRSADGKTGLTQRSPSTQREAT